MRVAWFSPVPPVRSGIAAYTAEVVPLLRRGFDVDVYDARRAHAFLYAHAAVPYDLNVYQLGNGRAHDYMWCYLARYPVLVVLHDARLHHARARMLLAAGRLADYRDEFRYSQPDAPPGAAEYAVEGLSGLVHYLWPMVRVPIATAKAVAVHNPYVAREIGAMNAGARVEIIRMGVPEPPLDRHASSAIRARLGIRPDDIVFAVFGKATPEKRVDAAVRALARLDGNSHSHLLVVGELDDGDALPMLVDRMGLRGRVHIAGYVADDQIGWYLGAADACLCLRWPTALETSASWLRCIAAARPTVISDLVHLADIPRSTALRVDVLDEDRTLLDAMRALAADRVLREQLGAAGHACWAANHTPETMADDYARVLRTSAARPAPRAPDLPRHVTDDCAGPARAIARRFGVDVDILADAG